MDLGLLLPVTTSSCSKSMACVRALQLTGGLLPALAGPPACAPARYGFWASTARMRTRSTPPSTSSSRAWGPHHCWLSPQVGAETHRPADSCMCSCCEWWHLVKLTRACATIALDAPDNSRCTCTTTSFSPALAEAQPDIALLQMTRSLQTQHRHHRCHR